MQCATDPMKCQAKHISRKLKEGDYKGAICIASSKDCIATLDSDTLRALKKNIPAITLSQVFLNFFDSYSPFAQAGEDEVLQAI